MQSEKSFENFPIWMPCVACALSLSIYITGAYILLRSGILFCVLYLLYCLWLEFSVLKESCANCCYYGKTCGLGRGKFCAMLFTPGDPQAFVEKEISWKHLLPDFFVFIFPLAGGIIYLIKHFTWLILALLAALAILSLGGNALMRGALACKYCRQRELGCPAEQLFNKRQAGTT